MSVKKAAESLLWVSLVSHLFIAPLSLISSHLLYCDTNPYVLLTQDDVSFSFQLPHWVHCCFCIMVVAEQNTYLCFVLKCLIWSAKIYGWCVNIQRQVCSRNSSSHVTLQACVDVGVIPEPREGLAAFCPDSSPHSRQGWRERLWPGLRQQLRPCNRWPWGKF